MDFFLEFIKNIIIVLNFFINQFIMLNGNKTIDIFLLFIITLIH